jgi:hypothetical protein
VSNEPDLVSIELLDVGILSKQQQELNNIRLLIMTNYERGPLFTKATLGELRQMSVFDLVVNCLNDFKEQA